MAKWIGAFEDIFMVGKWVSVLAGLFGISAASILFLTHNGPFGNGSALVASTPIDPGTAISASGDAMRQLKSMDVSLDGTLVVGGDGVQITGHGRLTYPHEEQLSLQLRVPAKVAGDQDTIVAVNELIEKGRVLVQIPSQGPAYRDVTNSQQSQIAPGMDPIANLEFSHAIRAADDQGDLLMDGVDVHHFSLVVSPVKYLQGLKADPENTLGPEAEAALTTAGIQVDVWIGSSDKFIHQMKVSITSSAYRWDVTYSYSNFRA